MGNKHKVIPVKRRTLLSNLKSDTSSEDHNIYSKEIDPLLKSTKRAQIRKLYQEAINKQEAVVIDDMLGLMTDPLQVAHFFCGGHIQMEGDHGQMYAKWVKEFAKAENVGARRSSHKSCDTQYGINGNVVSHILIGRRYMDKSDQYTNGKKYTWIQLENSPMGGLKEFAKAPITFIINGILHFLDFLDYNITKENIGRWGRSKHTEANPYIININEKLKEQAKERAAVWKELILDCQGDITAKQGILERIREVGIRLPHGYSNIVDTARV